MSDSIQPLDLARLRSDPAVRIIDVRTPGEFAAGHIAGSYNVPLAALAEHQAELCQQGARPVFLVCQSGRRAAVAEEQLRQARLDSVHVLDGGMVAWERAGLPLARLEADSAPWTLERQVRLVAGGIVAATVAASLVWPPARLVAGAVGAGLVLAAVTDTCAMGSLLARLPYNKRQPACDMPTVVSVLTQAAPEVAS
jgi:rhodanese-related sulfurtransferase